MSCKPNNHYLTTKSFMILLGFGPSDAKFPKERVDHKDTDQKVHIMQNQQEETTR